MDGWHTNRQRDVKVELAGRQGEMSEHLDNYTGMTNG